MPSPGWLNENSNRAFPFLRETVDKPTGGMATLPDALIVDAGFVMGIYSNWTKDDTVRLHSITRSGTTLTFEFVTTATGCHTSSLRFVRDISDAEYTTEYVEELAAPYGFSEASDSLFSQSLHDCSTEPLWSGFLVTGDISAIVALLPGDGTVTGAAGKAVVEPSLVQSMVKAYVASINTANQDRTRVTAADGCPAIDWPYPVGAGMVYVNGICLTGHIRFKPGYNTTMRLDKFENAIIIGASEGAGAGEPGAAIKLFDAEEPPEGSNLLEGGNCCNEVLRTINGTGGQFASVIGGLGVDIAVDPDLHKIVLDVNLSQLAACLTSDASETL